MKVAISRREGPRQDSTTTFIRFDHASAVFADLIGHLLLVALVADLIPAARQAGGERESRWRTATIFFCVIGVFREPSTPTPHYHHPTNTTQYFRF